MLLHYLAMPRYQCLLEPNGLRVILIFTLAFASATGDGVQHACHAAENKMLHVALDSFNFAPVEAVVNPLRWSAQVVLPWGGETWCSRSPCITVANNSSRSSEFGLYKEWLKTRRKANGRPFTPFLYEQRGGLQWRAPAIPWLLLQMRNASHGFQRKYSLAPFEQDAACEYWINTADKLILWNNIFPNNYGHWLHNHAIPLYGLWKLLGDSDTWLALPESELARKWLCWFDPMLLERVVFYPVGSVICTKARTVVPLPQIRGAHDGWATPPTSSLLNHRAFQLHFEAALSAPPAIVFASRSPKTVNHGRLLTNEQQVLDVVRDLMKKYERPEELVIYTGENVTFLDQFKTFSRATLVMGAHGSAMSNVIWTRSDSGCRNPVHVVEFVGGAVSGPRVQSSAAFSRTYYRLEGGVPWVNYHHVLFQAHSNEQNTYVDVQDIEAVLAHIWGGITSDSTKCFPAAWS